MTTRHRHSRLLTATGLAALSLAATLLLVLVSPVASALAFSPSSSDAHACCESEASEDAQHADLDCKAGVHRQDEQHSCGCRLAPADGDVPSDAVALTGSTVTFGPLVAAQTNIQVDIPLAREPDAALPTSLRASQPAAPLYLLNSVLLI